MRKDLLKIWNNKAYHDNYLKNHHNVTTMEEMCRPIAGNSSVLDVGCGVSRIGMYLLKSRKNVKFHGQDVSKTAIEMARKKMRAAKFVCNDCSRLKFPDNYFDYVISTYAIEHFSKPREVIDEMIRVGKPGGKIILISPAWDSPLIMPPILNRTPAKRVKNFFVQSKRQLDLMVRKKTNFPILDTPKHTIKEYADDTDTVYYASVREVVEYLKKKGMKIEYVHQWKLPVVRYFFRYMHIIAGKPYQQTPS